MKTILQTINLSDTIAVCGLCAALLASICFGNENIAMAVGGGLVGYLGRGGKEGTA